MSLKLILNLFSGRKWFKQCAKEWLWR